MTKLHVQTAGENGPRVIMIQGTGVAGCGWSPQVEALQDRYQLAWFDNRGIGKSPGKPTTLHAMAKDVEEVLEHLGWADAHVVGHSLGGVIAQAFAIHAPQRVLSLACLCTFLEGRAAVALDFSRVWIQVRTLIGTSEMRRKAFFQLVSAPNVACTIENIEKLEHVFGRRLEALPSVAMKQVRILAGAGFAEALKELDVPSLVLSATEDKVAPVQQGQALAEVLRAQFVELSGGHAVPVQNAKGVNEVLDTFWLNCS